jgi:hypothetical protein
VTTADYDDIVFSDTAGKRLAMRSSGGGVLSSGGGAPDVFCDRSKSPAQSRNANSSCPYRGPDQPS